MDSVMINHHNAQTNALMEQDNVLEMDSKCAEIMMEMAAQNGVAQLNAVMVNFVKEDFANHYDCYLGQ